MIIKKSERVKHVNDRNCKAYEYKYGDKDIDIAFIEIGGRYPEKGKVVNKISKEIIFVAKGKGKIDIDGKNFDIDEGDSVLIQSGQKYFFEGELHLVVCCHPPWDPKNYEYCD